MYMHMRIIQLYAFRYLDRDIHEIGLSQPVYFPSPILDATCVFLEHQAMKDPVAFLNLLKPQRSKFSSDLLSPIPSLPYYSRITSMETCFSWCQWPWLRCDWPWEDLLGPHYWR